MTPSAITRIWHGRTKAEHADDYLRYIQETGVRDYKSTPGNLSCQIWRRKEDQICHFWTVTRIVKHMNFEQLQIRTELGLTNAN
jgi:hypothetical protein